jgi:hypothetical protein
MGTCSPKAIPIHLNQIRSPPRLGVRTRLFSLKHIGFCQIGFCKCLAGMNIDCDEGSVKNYLPRLGMFKYRGLSTDMPEVVPFVFLMAWKRAMQPSEKTADLGRIIARLDTGDEPRDIAFQCLLPNAYCHRSLFMVSEALDKSSLFLSSIEIQGVFG